MTLIDFECPPCKGTGISRDPKSDKIIKCHKCGGLKIIQIDSERLTHHCWQCDGTGLRNGGPALCPTCRGDGYDRPGVPTGPGHSHMTLPGLRSGSVDPGGRLEITEPIMPPETEPEAGVNIEVPTDELTMTSYPPTIEIEESAKKRFAEAPQAVIADAKNSLAIALALQDILHQQRSNSDEANEAKLLLQRQHLVLTNIIEALQSDGDEHAARKSASQLLEDLGANLLRNAAKEGPVRGLLAVLVLSLGSVLGVELHWTSQLLITGSLVSKEVIEALRGWLSKRKKNNGE